MACTLFLLALVLTANACPYYILTPARTNYSSMTALLTDPFIKMTAPVTHACMGASIGVNETLPVIDFSFSMIGDNNPLTGEAMILAAVVDRAPPAGSSTAAFGDRAVFIVTGPGVYVSFTNMQFFFNSTLFYVNSTALLHLQYCNLWLGDIGVIIQTASNAAGTVGFLGEYVLFAETGVAIYQSTGFAVCTVCRFISSRNSAVSTASQLTANIRMSYSLWENTEEWVYIQPSLITPPTSFTVLPLPSNWGRVNGNLRWNPCTLSETPQSQSPSPPGFGSGGDSSGSGGGGSTEAKAWQIAAVVLLSLLIAVGATISVVRRNQSRYT